MVELSLADELTEADYNDFLKKQEVAHNDSVLADGESIFDFLNSREADFRRYPECKMIAEFLSLA